MDRGQSIGDTGEKMWYIGVGGHKYISGIYIVWSWLITRTFLEW
jgi:hypothetical protein